MTGKGEKLPVATLDNPVSQILAIWQPADGTGLDNHPCRGFNGQIFFMTKAKSAPARVNGKVRIYLFDDQGTRAERSKPIHQFDFEPEAWNKYLYKSELGPMYGVFIPYVRPGDRETLCSIRVRLTPVDGPPIFSELLPLALPGLKQQDYEEAATAELPAEKQLSSQQPAAAPIVQTSFAAAQAGASQALVEKDQAAKAEAIRRLKSPPKLDWPSAAAGHPSNPPGAALQAGDHQPLPSGRSPAELAREAGEKYRSEVYQQAAQRTGANSELGQHVPVPPKSFRLVPAAQDGQQRLAFVDEEDDASEPNDSDDAETDSSVAGNRPAARAPKWEPGTTHRPSAASPRMRHPLESEESETPGPSGSRAAAPRAKKHPLAGLDFDEEPVERLEPETRPDLDEMNEALDPQLAEVLAALPPSASRPAVQPLLLNGVPDSPGSIGSLPAVGRWQSKSGAAPAGKEKEKGRANLETFTIPLSARGRSLLVE
jgi:hypothetical protein